MGDSMSLLNVGINLQIHMAPKPKTSATILLLFNMILLHDDGFNPTQFAIVTREVNKFVSTSGNTFNF
jgi:hypothetical protein